MIHQDRELTMADTSNLTIISYNCKGFSASKVPCITKLLEQCNVLLMQETWLFTNQFQSLSLYFKSFSSTYICGMNESIFCQGRPYGGCSIMYSNKYDVTPIYFEDEKRICGIKITVRNTVFHIFNVYMPCDDGSIESFEMYNHVLSIISLYCIDNNVDVYLVGGDFNTSLIRTGSRQTLSLNSFVQDECLYYCCKNALSTVAYTFFGPTGITSLIDHVIITTNLSQCITKYETLDLIENISDHMPLLLQISGYAPMTSNITDGCMLLGIYDKALWSSASTINITQYKQCLDLHLSTILVPYDSLVCRSIDCRHEHHCKELNMFLMCLIESCILATKDSIPSSCQIQLSLARERSLFWHNMWKSCDKPSVGEVASIMRLTRKYYHYMIKKIKRDRNAAVRRSLGKALVGNKSRDYWLELE